MEKLKVLPKKAYSLDDAVKYISQNYNIDISKRDLIEYIQNGDLQSSIHIDGGLTKIQRVNKKILRSDQKLFIDSDNIVLSFTKELVKAKISELKEHSIIRIELNNLYFDISITLNNQIYNYNELKEYSYISLKGISDGLTNIIFEGYMPLDRDWIAYENSSEIIEKGKLEEFPDIIFNEDDFYFSLPIESTRPQLSLDDIVILHKDMIAFLEIFSIIDSNYSHPQAINELNIKIEELEKEITSKDKIIGELNSQTSKKQSSVSNNKKNAFIKSLLYIHYGESVAENPRPHIYDPNDSQKGITGSIQIDFNEKGLNKHLPSGKTLLNWVKGIELDTKE